MRYSGSKLKISKDLLPIITKHLNNETYYVEPFVGGCNMFSKVNHTLKIGADSNKYVIDMWKYFQNGGKPVMDVSEELYLKIKNAYLTKSEEFPDWMIGYVGNACSYGGAWFNGYARFNPNKNEDHIKEAYNGTMAQINTFNNFKESNFVCCDYEKLEIPKGSVIYCDPPYQDTKGYENSSFDHERFWEWCRQKAKDGCHIYISEYTAPSDFKCVWRKKKRDGMGTTTKGNKQKVKIEKLFIPKCH